ncbi:hypothetical protein [Streptomyces sp. NPDC093795]|uniref:hypothetical protein n=1 Tax=Streptomyces sp. NPDC093795 TaxID=3366051 RepID=UPI003824CDA1
MGAERLAVGLAAAVGADEPGTEDLAALVLQDDGTRLGGEETGADPAEVNVHGGAIVLANAMIVEAL